MIHLRRTDSRLIRVLGQTNEEHVALLYLHTY